MFKISHGSWWSFGYLNATLINIVPLLPYTIVAPSWEVIHWWIQSCFILAPLQNCLAVSLPCGYGKAALDRGLPQIQLPLALASFTVASFMFNLLCISKVIVIPLVQTLCTSQSYFLSFVFYFLRLRHKCMVGGMCVLYKSTCPSCRKFHSHFNEKSFTWNINSAFHADVCRPAVYFL